MNDFVKCDIASVEQYKKDIIKFYEMQITNFQQLKNKFDKSIWEDEKLVFRINQINECLSKIADAIDAISDGYNVRVIDKFLKQCYEYTDTCKNYPK